MLDSVLQMLKSRSHVTVTFTKATDDMLRITLIPHPKEGESAVLCQAVCVTASTAQASQAVAAAVATYGKITTEAGDNLESIKAAVQKAAEEAKAATTTTATGSTKAKAKAKAKTEVPPAVLAICADGFDKASLAVAKTTDVATLRAALEHERENQKRELYIALIEARITGLTKKKPTGNGSPNPVDEMIGMSVSDQVLSVVRCDNTDFLLELHNSGRLKPVVAQSVKVRLEKLGVDPDADDLDLGLDFEDLGL